MANFPLIVADDPKCKRCPECGMCNAPDDKECGECGASLEGVEEQFDDLAMEDITSEMERTAEKMNEGLLFHNVEVKSGYYVGVQFYVEEKYNKLEDFTNEDTQYEFGMCRSKTLRKYETECNKIRRELHKAREELGLELLGCIGIFSNGEAVYTKIDPKKGPTVRQAAKMSIAAAS
jgi:hypothetical protein